MMKNKKNARYVKLGVTLSAVAAVSLVLYFLLKHSASFTAFGNSVLKILMPFIYGAVIAYLLAPLCNKIEKLIRRASKTEKKWPAALSIVAAMLLAFLVIAILLILVIPNVVQSILQIVNAIPAQMENASQILHTVLEEQPELQSTLDGITENINSTITSWLQKDLSSTLQKLAVSFSGQIAGLMNLFKNIFLGVLISVYLLGSRKKFAVQARLLLCGVFPKKWADMIEEEVHYADRMFNGFLVGRIIDSAIIGVICFAFCWLFKFESAVLVSVIVGVTNVIPVFGPYLGAIPCALLLLIENPLHCLIFLIFILVLQQVDGNVIGPRILGQTTGVSSFWVLFSVLLFGGLWGIIGMLVGVPLFAVIYDVVRKLAYAGLKRHGRDDLLKDR